jgi:uncharacterized repeat protein (TIGR03803 family)
VPTTATRTLRSRRISVALAGALLSMALSVSATSAAYAAHAIVLHKFNSHDGAMPMGRLVADANGSLYGTTSAGGSAGHGTVFELVRSTSGYTFSTLHEFQGTDGADPYAGLTMDSSGALYGTTYDGGDPSCGGGCGTVFKLTPSGSSFTFSMLYAFAGQPNDGANPYAGVAIGAGGVLFGTTQSGGPSAWCSIFGQFGCGTVYALTPNGTSYDETVLHAFAGQADGAIPTGTPALDAHGMLYGVTFAGGTGSATCGQGRCGTIFRIDAGPRHTKTTVHFFGGSAKHDGAGSYGDVIINRHGDIFGTTSAGGKRNSTCPQGCGIVFRLAGKQTGYSEEILYSFTAGTDGGFPQDGLVANARGDLFGTTPGGGASGCGAGCGTVYELAHRPGGYREKTIYAFRGGSLPWFAGEGDALLLDSAGDLFGASVFGGNTAGNCAPNGCGTLYEIAH